jgi:hypothetical protein
MYYSVLAANPQQFYRTSVRLSIIALLYEKAGT